MLLSDKLFKLVLQLLDLLIKACHVQVVLGIIWLLEGLLWHVGYDGLDRHEQVVTSTTPLGKLILLEARIKDAAWCIWLILMRHLLSLLVKFLLRRQLLLWAGTSTLLAIFGSGCLGCVALALPLVGSLLRRLRLLDLLTIDNGRVLGLVSTSSSASGSSRWSLGLLLAIGCLFRIDGRSIPATSRRLRSFFLLTLGSLGILSILLAARLDLVDLLLLGVFLAVWLASTSILALTLVTLLFRRVAASTCLHILLIFAVLSLLLISLVLLGGRILHSLSFVTNVLLTFWLCHGYVFHRLVLCFSNEENLTNSCVDASL